MTAKLSSQPGFSGAPITHHRFGRNAKGFGGLIDAQPREESHLDDLAPAVIERRQHRQRIVEGDEVEAALDGDLSFDE
jgi:hypothetical protein